MAILGGGVGGAGNPVSGSFTGPASALEIIADHAYAYSGLKQIDTSNVEHLNFTSGNYLFVGEITMYGAVDTANLGLGDISGCTVSFNGVDLFTVKIDTEQEDMSGMMVFPIMIPPYTEVEVNVITDDDSTNHLTAVNLSGRIYRTRD